MLSDTLKLTLSFFFLLICLQVFAGDIPMLHQKRAQSDSVNTEKFAPSPLAVNVKPAATVAGNCYDINWATWSTVDNVNSTVGSVVDADGTPIGISMTANYSFGSTPSIYGFSRFASYPSTIPNSTVPKTTWAAGPGGTTTLCFSRKVTNPVLLLSSLGSSLPQSARLNFSIPYVVLYDGGGMVYNTSTAITGTEGYAIIMFPGDFTCVTINSSTPENYTNLTWGVRPQPFTVNITDGPSDCGSATVTASGGSTYKWNGGDTPNQATNTFHQSGTYLVTVTNANGCVTSLSKTVTINAALSPVISGTATACGAVTLTASGGNTYLWNGGSNPNSATNTFTTSGTYTVTVTNASGCSGTASQTVTISTPPTPAITGTTIGCSSVTLTATGGANYLWDGGSNPNSATNTFTTSGTYHVTVTNTAGCTATIAQTVTINPLPAPTISGNTSACNSVTLTAAGGITYLWNGGSNPNSATNTFTTSGTYTVTATNAGGCTSTASVNVTILSPVIIITGSTTGCTGVTVTASGGNTYLWNGGSNPHAATNTFATSGAYTVTVTNAVGCTSTATVNVDISLPVAVITGNATGCGSVTLTASGGNTYQWTGGNTPTAATNTFTSSGNYSVTVTNANGCTNTASVLVTINPVPMVSLPQSITIIDHTPVKIVPAVTGHIASYLWSPAEGLSDATIADPLIDPANTTNYTLTVTTVDGCTSSAIVTANAIIGNIVVPNTFTPNGDGVNDTWIIKNLSNFPASKIAIFTRWGQKVYGSTGYPKPWDGTYNGKRLAASVYYYLITIDDINIKKAGWVTIIY